MKKRLAALAMLQCFAVSGMEGFEKDCRDFCELHRFSKRNGFSNSYVEFPELDAESKRLNRETKKLWEEDAVLQKKRLYLVEQLRGVAPEINEPWKLTSSKTFRLEDLFNEVRVVDWAKRVLSAIEFHRSDDALQFLETLSYHVKESSRLEWNLFVQSFRFSNGERSHTDWMPSHKLYDDIRALLGNSSEGEHYIREQEQYRYKDIMFRLELEAYRQEHIEDWKRRFEELTEKFKQEVSGELMRASREPDMGREQAATEKLKEQLQGQIDEVRFIDARTLINAMNLDDDRKKTFKELVGSTEKITPLIEAFISRSQFKGDDEFKRRIRRDLLQGARNPVYRNFILTLIAWSESKPSVCDQFTVAGEKLGESEVVDPFVRAITFASGSECSAFYNKITMKYSPSLFLYSLFNYLHAMNIPGGFTLFPALMRNVLFHEGGHVTSANLVGAAGILGMTSSSMLVASNLFDISAIDKAIQHNVGLLKQNTAGETVEQAEQRVRLILSDLFHEDFSSDMWSTNLENLISWADNAQKSREIITRRLFHNEAELFQIAGMFVVNNTLYLNKLSDICLSASMGVPIRADHNGVALSQMDVEAPCCPAEVEAIAREMKCPYELFRNQNLHGALFQAFGFNTAEYEQRLCSSVINVKSPLVRSYLQAFRYLIRESPMYPSSVLHYVLDSLWNVPYKRLEKALIEEKRISDEAVLRSVLPTLRFLK
jgi:hypothetical protein